VEHFFNLRNVPRGTFLQFSASERAEKQDEDETLRAGLGNVRPAS